jgi:hypothetical protein
MKRNMPVTFLVALFVLAGLLTTLSLTNASNDRGNAAPSQMLPADLQARDIKDYFLPAEGQAVGHLGTIIGHVVVVREDAQQAYFAAKGDAVYQQDSFITLKGSRCRIKFTTQDVVTMAENTRITVQELVDDRKAQKKKSFLSMLRGKAMFYVVRLFKYKRTEASVTTPTAVCGVRGTQFGIEIQSSDGSRAQSVPIYLADASEANWPLLARTSTGDQTVVYFYDGSGELCNADGSNCFPVSQGESGLVDQEGNVYVSMADPAQAEQFRRDTDVGPGAGEDDYSDKYDEQPPWAGTFPDKIEPEVGGEHTKDVQDEAVHQRDGYGYDYDQGPTGAGPTGALP